MSIDYPEHYHTGEEPPTELHITLTDNDINTLRQKGEILADEGHGYTIVITYKRRLPGRPPKGIYCIRDQRRYCIKSVQLRRLLHTTKDDEVKAKLDEFCKDCEMKT